MWGFRIVKDWQFEVSGCGLDNERLFPTFWSCAELEDGGGVGPALLVPRLDYHLKHIDHFNTLFFGKDKI